MPWPSRLRKTLSRWSFILPKSHLPLAALEARAKLKVKGNYQNQQEDWRMDSFQLGGRGITMGWMFISKINKVENRISRRVIIWIQIKNYSIFLQSTTWMRSSHRDFLGSVELSMWWCQTTISVKYRCAMRIEFIPSLKDRGRCSENQGVNLLLQLLWNRCRFIILIRKPNTFLHPTSLAMSKTLSQIE